VNVTDPDLHDPDLLEEIELLGELVIAASGSDGSLPTASIDAILGVRAGMRSSHGDDQSRPEATDGSPSA
jgi:hypothetical protein